MHRFSWKWQFVGNKAKGGISKRVFQENKARQIFRKTNIFTPWYAHLRTCANQGVKRTFFSPWYAHVRTCANKSGSKKCSFFGKFGLLSFLETRILRLPYYRRVVPTVSFIGTSQLIHSEALLVSIRFLQLCFLYF